MGSEHPEENDSQALDNQVANVYHSSTPEVVSSLNYGVSSQPSFMWYDSPIASLIGKVGFMRIGFVSSFEPLKSFTSLVVPEGV